MGRQTRKRGTTRGLVTDPLYTTGAFEFSSSLADVTEPAERVAAVRVHVPPRFERFDPRHPRR